MKEPVSFKWVVAFFFIGAVLGLLVLQVMKGRTSVVTEPVASWSAPPVEVPASGVEKRPTSAPRVSVSRAPQVVPADVAERKAQDFVVPPTETQAVTTTVEPMRCNQEIAFKVREKALETTEIVNEGTLLKVRLRGEWDYYSDSVRRSFMVKFADSDACLNGQSRPIDFYYQGKLYAHADPDKGIEFK